MSRNRIILVANTIGTAGSSAASFSDGTTLGQLNLFEEGFAGAMNRLENGRGVQAFPKVHVGVGNGATYPLDMIHLDGKGIVSWKSVAYTAGYVKSIVAGYDGVNAYNAPVNIYNSSEYMLRILKTDIDNDGDRPSVTGKSWSVMSGYNAASSDHGRYNILRDLVTLINAWDDSPARAMLRQSETILVMTANCVVVNGSASVTSTAHGMIAGNFAVLGGDVYRIVSVTVNAFVLDRPYAGVSGTIVFNQATPANCDVVNGGVTVTTGDTTGIAANTFVTLGNAVYVVQSIDAGVTFVIDRPYEGATATLVAGVTPGTAASTLGAAGYVAAATVDDNTNFGIHFIGKSVDVDFDAFLEYGFDGDEVVATKNDVTFSVGTYAEVAKMEKEADQIFGTTQTMMNRTGRIRKATDGFTYDKWVVTFNNYTTSNMGGYHAAEIELVIWLRSTATNTMLFDYFNDWLLTSNGSGGFSDV